MCRCDAQALDMLEEEGARRGTLPLGCAVLDAALQGGIRTASVTEVRCTGA